MKIYYWIFTIAASLILNASFAHQDFWVVKDYGNIKVRIKTGHKYEEINKAMIIGKLAEGLAKKLHYSKTVFLDFNHHYTGRCNPDYFISFDKGLIQYTWNSNSEKDFLTSKSIVIRQVSHKFDIVATLKLLEYAINNINSIKSNQKSIKYEKNYCQWIINSIDTVLIKKQLVLEKSPLLNLILSQRVYRSDTESENYISYYWQDSQFHIFIKPRHNSPDTMLLSLDNVYDLRIFGLSEGMVFDTDSTFFYINIYYKKPLSKKQFMKVPNDYFWPYDITMVGSDKIFIYLSYFSKDRGDNLIEQTMVYLTKKDRLVEDLDKLINDE